MTSYEHTQFYGVISVQAAFSLGWGLLAFTPKFRLSPAFPEVYYKMTSCQTKAAYCIFLQCFLKVDKFNNTVIMQMVSLPHGNKADACKHVMLFVRFINSYLPSHVLFIKTD